MRAHTHNLDQKINHSFVVLFFWVICEWRTGIVNGDCIKFWEFCENVYSFGSLWLSHHFGNVGKIMRIFLNNEHWKPFMKSVGQKMDFNKLNPGNRPTFKWSSVFLILALFPENINWNPFYDKQLRFFFLLRLFLGILRLKTN